MTEPTIDPETGEITTEQPPQMFSEFISEHYKRGDLDAEITMKMAELVQQLDAMGGSGSVTITLKLKKDSARAITMTEKVDVKLPPEPRGQAIFFPNGNGELFRDDPYAKKIPFPNR